MFHDKTKAKVKKLFSIGDSFCDSQLEKYSDSSDIMFIVEAFSTSFSDFDFKLRTSKNYDIEMYHNDIFDLDSILSSWKSNLVYNLPYDNDNTNDLYTVLFSILQGVEELLDDDHFYWEEDEEKRQEIESSIDLDLEYSLTTNDDDYIERTF